MDKEILDSGDEMTLEELNKELDSVDPAEIEANDALIDKSRRSFGILALGFLAVMVAVVGIIFYNSTTKACRVPEELITDVVPQAEVVIGLDEHWILTAEPKSAALEFRTKNLAIDLSDIEKPEVFDIFKSYLYIENFSSFGEEQSIYYVCKNPQAINGMTAEDMNEAMKSPTNETKENVVQLENSVQAEYLTSMYKEGCIYNANAYANGIERANVDLNKLSSFTENEVEGIKITIDGFGTFNLDDLDIFTGDYGVVYSVNDGMVTLFDESSDFSAVWITHMQNEKLGNMFGELIPVDGYNNVYVDIGFKSNADFGYGGFAVMTEVGMYYFKISEVYSDPIDIATKLLTWLGVDFTAEVIDIGIEFPFTVDDMLEPNTSDTVVTE